MGAHHHTCPILGCFVKHLPLVDVLLGHYAILAVIERRVSSNGCTCNVGATHAGGVRPSTCGSSGSGDASSACRLRRAVLRVSAGLHLFFRMSKQMAPVALLTLGCLFNRGEVRGRWRR
jgi:hypothetical protein